MSRDIKVLIILPHLNRGGAERVLLNYALIIKKETGFNVDVLVVGSEGPLYDEFACSLDFKYLNKRTSRAFIAYLKFLRNNQHSFIITSHYTTALLVQMGKIFSGCYKHIARVPGSPVYEKMSSYYGLIRRHLFGWALRQSDVVISQTGHMKNEINSIFKVNAEKIRVLENPINEERLNKVRPISFPGVTVVSAGRLHEVKGFDILFRAIHKLRNKEIEINCVLIGSDKGQKSLLLSIIEDLNLKDIVSIIPETEELLNYIAGSNGFILSSRSEGLPNVLLEALYLGIPCVSTNCFGGVENLITHGSNGLICDISVEGLADSIEELINTEWNVPPFEKQQDSIINLINYFNV